jgi:4-deoxy-L-threo-5-hexosulose-uronate ketol-isomerase
MSSEEIRHAFLIPDLFRTGEVNLRAIDMDRVIIGGVVPHARPIALEPLAGMAAEYFAERREVGVINVGGPGTVTVDGTSHRLGHRDGLYIGRGARAIEFETDAPESPARFYLVSYPAHASHPVKHMQRDEVETLELGDTSTANRRRLSKYFHPGSIPTAQLVMGITEIQEGSVWNTMPPHTHQRRTEVYLYFDLPEDVVVFHLMGEPTETRSIVVRESEAVLSPAWSIHAGCGTGRYSFCWAMGGENQDFSDMQGVAMGELR